MDHEVIVSKEFTTEELSTYNGINGKPAYVAINGVVHDMSKITAWRDGTHFGLFAGKDLSTEFMECHQGMQLLLNMLPQAGILKK